MAIAADPPEQIQPYRQPADAVLAALATDARGGLSGDEARARLARHGRNELQAEPGDPAWKRFLAQFKDVLVVLLLVATAISAALWVMEGAHALPYEALAIFAVVTLNAVLGFVQESRAASAVAALRQMAAAQAHVIRDGERRTIPAAEVVSGDVIVIEEGDTIPADARMIHSTALQTAESALTGESLPVSKDTLPIDGEAALGDRHNMLFSGTAATYGRGKAVVVATGMQTEMGRIAGMLKETRAETTPLQKELARVGKLLGGVVVAIAVVMIVTIIVVEDVRGAAALFDVLILGVALAVAAVPEGLPAVVTAVLSLGVQRAARRNAIVRHLSAVETLGSASVIASDKTGTLTKNEMTVRVVVTASGQVRFEGTGYTPEGGVRREGGGEIDGPLRIEFTRALAAADRANNAVLQEKDDRWTVQGDPTEGALIVAALKAGMEEEALATRFARIAEVPFSSERKLMSTIHTDAEHRERLLAFTKGAPDVLLARCTQEQVGEGTRPLDADRRAWIAKENEALATEALRTLAVAYRSLPADAFTREEVDSTVEEDLVFLGLIGMIDPPREEARDAVARTRAAGIRPMMITGDHPITAAVIAKEAGIAEDGRAVTGADIEAMSDEALDRTVLEASVFARVNPEHKLRIVQALQRGGAVVAMTGDGVNDAPALKTADIGVAMGMTGTDVSKEAADMVLADDNFATIVAAVEEGRAIYANIRKFLRYLLSSNIGEVMTMFFGVLLADAIGLTAERGGVVLPLLATQLLWINLVSDGAPALALGVDPPRSRPLIASSIRDVLVAPTKPARIAEAHERLARLYDIVFVHGDPDLVRLEDSWPLDEPARSIVHYTGYVDEGAAVEPAEARSGIVVSGGSSAASLPLCHAALGAAAVITEHPWHLLVGNGVNENDLVALRAAAPAHVTVERARGDFRALLCRAALSVSQAGYNTAVDVLRSRVPALLVPFEAGHETEQRLRAERLQDRGLASLLPESELTAERLAREVPKAMAQVPPATTIGLEGAPRTVALAEDLVRRPPVRVRPLPWHRLDDALGRAADGGRSVTLWWRDDDAVAATPRLDRLLRLSARYGIPLAVAAIPGPSEPSLAARLLEEPLASLLVHGLTHKNHAPQGEKKAEVGPHRLLKTLSEECALALAIARSAFGSRLLPVFVPPWNRIAAELVDALPGLGYRGLSRFAGRRFGDDTHGLVQADTHVDPIDWRGTRTVVDPAQVIGALADAIDTQTRGAAGHQKPIGILTHHLVHDEATWHLCESLLERLSRQQTIRYPPADEIFLAAPGVAKKP